MDWNLIFRCFSTLLRHSAGDRLSPYRRRIYPTALVTGMPDLVARLEARFGSSPVHIKTPRGRHLYYRATGAVPNLRGEGLPVDIKTGACSYVMGPLSVRPDGGFYDPVKGGAWD